MPTALLKGKMLVFVVIYGFRCKESNLLRQTVSVIRNLDSPFDNLASSGSPAGSTSTVVTFLYQQSFSYMDMGYGSAAAMVLLAIIFVLSLVRMLVSRGEN